MFDLATDAVFDAPLVVPRAPQRRGAPAALRRPRLLVRAAKAGAALYRRERDLAPLLPAMATSARKAADVASRLEAAEAELEALRMAGAPDYPLRRHVAVLSALLAERAVAAGLS
ncbi:MAG TPA: DUF6477 family protein [Paracoccaceae bacterium]|nr:DUF6477 family protein [Paracoccaceae bacterium]